MWLHQVLVVTCGIFTEVHGLWLWRAGSVVAELRVAAVELTALWHFSCGILVPHQGSNLCPLQSKLGFLITGQPGKSQNAVYY